MGLSFDRVAELYDRVRPRYHEVLIDFATRRAADSGRPRGRVRPGPADRGARRPRLPRPGGRTRRGTRRAGSERAPGAVVNVGRFEDVPIAAAASDAVFSATAFHWVDPAVGCANAARVLRRPGILPLLSHVFMADERARPAREALARIYGADWRIRTADALIEQALELSGNISDVWAWLENPAIGLPEAAWLSGEARFHAVPEQSDLTAGELLDLRRTTSTICTSIRQNANASSAKS